MTEQTDSDSGTASCCRCHITEQDTITRDEGGPLAHRASAALPPARTRRGCGGAAVPRRSPAR